MEAQAAVVVITVAPAAVAAVTTVAPAVADMVITQILFLFSYFLCSPHTLFLS